MAKASSQQKKRVKTRKKASTPKARRAPAAPDGQGAAVSGGEAPRKPARKKRAAKQVREVVLPRSTSERVARQARASVWAISSDKTLEQYEAALDLARDEERQRTDQLADPQAPALEASLRRSARDLYGFWRAELARPEEDAEDPHFSWRHVHKRTRHEMQPGASPESLDEVEQRLRLTLPTSYWDFCLEWSGGLLYVQQGGCFRVVAPQGMIREIKGPLCNRMIRPHLPGVDLGCGDYLAFDTSKQARSGEWPLVWWYGGEPKKKVADSFAAWLKRLVEVQGHPYWWEA